MRAFCAIAFDPDPTMQKSMLLARELRGKKASHFDVYTQFVPATFNGTEQLAFRVVGEDTVSDHMNVNSISLDHFIKSVTFEWKHSGREIKNMNTARGNGNLGNVVVRFNIINVREAYWYLDILQAHDVSATLCQRVDRLIVNFQPMRIPPDRLYRDLEDRDVVRDWDKIVTPPSSKRYDPKNQVAGIVKLAREVNLLVGCRATIHVIDETGKMLVPSRLSDRQVFYAILAGQPTFDERVAAQTATWMTAVPQDRLTIFTNVERNADEMQAAGVRDVAVVKPHQPELEKRLPLMQSWSHLVRVRESWDRTMKNDPDIKWLALVDDDTFVFPGGMREYLSKFDHRLRIWGGSGEMARIENGDGGQFATWLRKIHKSFGGKDCYLDTENVPKHLQGMHIEYGISKVLNGRKVARRVSHMCHDTFCKLGCPAVPQGAAIFLSRTLVEALRPHIEECEKSTSGLCKNCGSQRLYMCVNRFAGPARTLLTRGICRAPWKLEHREKFPFAITFHGFNRYRGMARSTGSLHGDMVELWQLGKRVEEGVKHGLRSSYLISMSNIADLIGCHGQGKYEKGECLTADGIRLPSTDGHPKKDRSLRVHQALRRKGSA